MFEHSIVVRSGQAWKLVVFLAGGVTMLLGLYTAFFSSIPLSETTKMMVYLGSLILGVGSIAFLALGLRCPKCGTRWGWWQMRHGGVDLFAGLMMLRECPACGFSKP